MEDEEIEPEVTTDFCWYEDRLNKQQVRAVVALEKVLKRCKRVGLAIVGRDDNLEVYRAKDLRAQGWDEHPEVAVKQLDYGVLIDDGGAYWDSQAT